MNNPLPADVKRQLLALDTAITPALVQGSWAILAPYHEKLGYLAPRIARDVSYGPHERHRLDVHTSDDLPEKPPFHLQAAGLVSAWFARHGTVPNLAWAQRHNQIASLGVDEDALGTQLARFVAHVTEATQ